MKHTPHLRHPEHSRRVQKNWISCLDSHVLAFAMLRRVLRMTAVGIFLLSITPTLAAQTIDVVLNYHPNPTHASLYEMKREGFDTKHGFNLNLIVPSDFQIGPKMVAAKKAHATLTYAYYLYTFVYEGMPLKRISTLINTPMNALMTLKKSGITTIKDLKGKRLGVHSMGTGKLFITRMLKSAGLSDGDVTFIMMKNQGNHMLLQGSIDAMSGVHRILDADLIRAHGGEPVFFHYEDYGVPSYEEMIIIAHKDDARAPWVKSFNAALKESTASLKKDPGASYAFMKNTLKTPTLYSGVQWRETAPTLSATPEACNATSYEKLIAFFKEERHDNKKITIDDLL